MKSARSLLVGAVLLVGTHGLHAAEGWVTDMEVAKQQAAKEGKDLLVDFTGSDWCGWCKKLVSEVFSQDAFKAGVKDTFVLVELDFPRDKSKLSAEALAANKELAKKYAVRGYPTIMLCDAQGRPYAKTGYKAGGPEAYVAHLNELRAFRVKRDEAFEKAKATQGVEKAKALIAALETLKVDSALVTEFYGEVAGQIKEADPADESGFNKKAEMARKTDEFGAKLNELGRAKKFDEALKLCDETLAKGEITGADAQRVMASKAMVYMSCGRFDEASAQFDKAIAFLPESSQNAGYEAMKARIVTIREKIEEMKKAKEQEQQPAKPEEGKDPGPPVRLLDKGGVVVPQDS